MKNPRLLGTILDFKHLSLFVNYTNAHHQQCFLLRVVINYISI